uniref:pyruvate, water dikinase n=1 Tax=Aplanochytrium stocchinoi TaxID=215587 RepID=A0A7S3LRR7_9STRA|mmetsp:Transcript_18227/g.22484  ORF Transcript_18227/g.22484 Transcript_18227/m.22484 type:complete len:795 (+) Transcript_18227:522-2906(+)
MKTKKAKLQASVFALCSDIRTSILKLQFDDDLKGEISGAHERLGNRNPVACRSSATTEDTHDASFAGQHDTFLNQRNLKDVLSSIKKCWASIFTDRAVEYRTRNGIAHADAIMCVVIQNMVEPEVSGTAFSTEISTSFPGIHVAALYGLGEGLVSGEITSDEWLLNRDSFDVIRQVCGSKREYYQSRKSRSGIELKKTSLKMQNELCINHEMVKAIASQIRRIQSVYRILFGYEDVDTEIAIKKGKVIFLQCRPVVEQSTSDVLTVNQIESKNLDSIATGNYSLLGAAHGRIKVISDFNLLVQGKCAIGKDDIVVTTKTSNYWNQYLTELRGIITVEGSPTAHPMLIGRERGLAVICGCSVDTLDHLRAFEGNWCTIDGLNKKVYLGKQPLVKCSGEEFQSRFGTVEIERALNDSDNIRYLEKMGRVHQYPDSGSMWWVHQPNTYLSPAWLELMCGQYEAAVDHIKAVRNDVVDFQVPSFRIDHERSKVASEYLSYDYLLTSSKGPYKGMTLKECVALRDRYNIVSCSFLSTCQKFSQNPSLANWKAYESSFRMLHGAIYTHHAFREHVKTQSTKLAHDLNISQFHFDQFQSDHMGTIDYQEDTLFRLDIIHIATLLAEKHESENETFMNLDSIREYYPDILLKLEKIAIKYRLSKDTDIAQEPPVDQLFEKVAEAMIQIQAGKLEPIMVEPKDHTKGYFPSSLLKVNEINSTSATEWFPEAEYQELRRWANLSIELRVQMCNLHHWKVRGNAMIKQGLIEVQEHLNLPKNILKLSSLQDIRESITDYCIMTST